MTQTDLEQSCGFCPGFSSYYVGLKGERADKTKFLFVLHRPDLRVVAQQALPHFDQYTNTLVEAQTGKKLIEMLEFCDLGFEHVYLTNIFKCVLAKDRTPGKREYEMCFAARFLLQVSEFHPKKIVAFGGKVYELMFSEQAKKNKHADSWGEELEFQQVPTLVFPHPSRIWFKSQDQRDRLYEMLRSFLQK